MNDKLRRAVAALPTPSRFPTAAAVCPVAVPVLAVTANRGALCYAVVCEHDPPHPFPVNAGPMRLVG